MHSKVVIFCLKLGGGVEKLMKNDVQMCGCANVQIGGNDVWMLRYTNEGEMAKYRIKY
jgi:hypothetical protein